MNAYSIILCGLLAFSIVAISGLVLVPDAIEAGLANDIRSALEQEDVTVDTIAIVGRDVTFQASVGSVQDSMILADRVSEIDGIQQLVMAVTVQPPLVEQIKTVAPDTAHSQAPQIEIDIKALLAEGSIEFTLNEDRLLPSSYRVLNRIASALRNYPNSIVEIGGHTDNLGDEPVNTQLSLQRAAAVRDYLLGHGIDARCIEVKGYGSSKPLVPNSSKANRERNRRVEFRLIGELES